ncbi:hypothetical protein JVU11DRAFT_9906 [Chiua virens]|nr:hypothetical protein JVU11DRAFT_9906 [Chiua virens]
MEQMLDQSKSAHSTIFSDPAHRMSQRPLAVKSGEGRSFEVIGSSLNPPKVAHTNLSKSKSKAGVKPPPKPRSAPPPMAEDESDDEILLSSQNSTSGHATSTLKRVPKNRKQDISSEEEETVHVNGRVLAAHPHYKPSSLDVLKGLRFTKNKKKASGGDNDLFKPIFDDIEILDGLPSPSLPKPRETSMTRHRSRSPTAGRASNANHPSIPKPSSPTPKRAPPAKPRPRPRVVITRRRCSSPESTPRPAPSKRDLPLRTKSPESPADLDNKRIAKKPFYPSSPRREPREFPVPSQSKENISDGSRSSDASARKTKKPAIPHSKTIVQTPKRIPLPSPLRPKPVSRGNTFLNLSPLSTSNNKNKTRAESSDEDNTHSTRPPEKRRGPRPFPMSSQDLADIDKRSKSPNARDPGSMKRLSSEDSNSERGHSAKKRKDSRSGVLDLIDHLHEPMEDDSIDIGYARDPSTICPYCDEELPSHPTPLLQHLLVTARKKSVSDPRPRNRGGLRAPLTVYISVCQRHRFESHQLPIATKKGWPKTIDFTKVPLRVKKMKKALESIILDKDDISDVENLDIDEQPKGPKRKSIFWREVKKEVKKKGIRAVVGVKGQFASFEKTQPGYYGEQGSVIIHQTLFDLFPPSNLDPSLISPLTPAEFIQRILVPEAAVRLIAQDLCLDIEDAAVTLRESAQYGVAMFPDTSENKRRDGDIDDDEMGVADRIVMERARIRRKELEEEERVENDMIKKDQAAQRARARESRRGKALERAQKAKEAKAHAEDKMRVEEASEASEAGGARTSRPKMVKQARRDDRDSDAMSIDSLSGKRSTRTAKKKMPVDGRESVRGTPKLTGSDSEPEARLKIKGDKKSFGRFASLDDDDEEHENTPQPVRRPTTTVTNPCGLDARILPLQAARNRSGVSGSVAYDGWSRNLRTGVPDGTDSDASNASRSGRLIGSSMKSGSFGWLFSGSSDSHDSS